MANYYGANSLKISEFQTVTGYLDSDLLTFVRNGTNFKATFASLKSDLGVTGSITSVGAPLASPILTGSGTDYQIRSLESNKGIVSSVSAQNGINIACNFTQSNSGFPIINNLNDSQYKFKTLKATAPIEITSDDDFITISQSESPLAQTNTVVVSDITDFPTPSSGVITLDNDTNYIIVQPISTSNRFQCGTNNHITSNNPFTPLFEYTGVGTMFTGVDVNFLTTFCVLSAPNGQLFDFSSTSSGNTFGIDTVTISGCNKFGTFDDLRSFNATNVGGFNCNDGVTFAGVTNWEVSSAIRFRLETSSATFVGMDFTNSVHKTLEIADPIFRGPVGAIGLSGLANSGNVQPEQIAAVTNGEFSGGLTPLQNINEDDARWEFQGNTGIPDSMTDGLISVVGSSTETVIPVRGVKVKVNNTWTEEITARFDFDASGRLTYVGERPIRLPIDVTSTILMASGGDKQVEMCIAINGVAVTQTCKQATSNSSKAASVTTFWQYEFKTGDYVEVFVSNEDDTTKIIVQQAIVRIN
jgi:hypothetical protein